MTLVVTTVSRWGITVVGDRAETSDAVGPEELYAIPEARKVFFARAPRVSLAVWGNARWPYGDFDEWVLKQLMPTLESMRSLHDIAQTVCDRVNEGMREIGVPYEKLRRGIHVAGYVDGLPHLYHCHMGDEPPALQSELKVYSDYPEIHGGGLQTYRARIKRGQVGQLRNGRHDLFNFIGQSLENLRKSFQQLYNTPLPEPSLLGQLHFDIALVKFAAGLIWRPGKCQRLATKSTGMHLTLLVSSCPRKTNLLSSAPSWAIPTGSRTILRPRPQRRFRYGCPLIDCQMRNQTPVRYLNGAKSESACPPLSSS